jgi:hypothetical protein
LRRMVTELSLVSEKSSPGGGAMTVDLHPTASKAMRKRRVAGSLKRGPHANLPQSVFPTEEKKR